MKMKISALLLLLAPVVAQAQNVPDAELKPQAAPAPAASQAAPAQPVIVQSATAPATPAQSEGYEMSEIMQAADGAFGKAAENMAMVIEKTFKDLGKPTAYIVGREGGGAFIVGLRYGRGQLFHKVEGQREVFWTGPSLGLDFGGDASRSFVLIYNLHDSEELFQRFPAVEGKAYLIGGVSANYHQRGPVVLVPVRLGAGWRIGANVGYLHYTKKGRILPF